MTARFVAWRILRDVDTNDAYANLVTPRELRSAGLSKPDAAFVTELVYGSLRMRGLYDVVIAHAARRDIQAVDAEIRDVLRLACHQWIALQTPAHATVSESVNLCREARLSRGAGFVNAVVRRMTERSPDEWLAIVAPSSMPERDRLEILTSHPAWIIDVCAEALTARNRGHELEDFLRADNVAPRVSLVDLGAVAVGNDDSDGRSDELTALLESSCERDPRTPFSWSMRSGDPESVVDATGGLVRVQDVGSQIAVLALVAARDVQPGERWLDMCAGPGGKAALLAALARHSGAAVHANEVSAHRTGLVRRALAPFPEVAVTTRDGRSFGAGDELFDRILIDAPCTGLGALRRRPEARWRKTFDDISQLVSLQTELLEAACGAVAPGGLIAYVTCTPTLAETLNVVETVFGARPDFVPIDVKPLVDHVTQQAMTPRGESATVQLWPHSDGTDAMFISIFEHVSG